MDRKVIETIWLQYGGRIAGTLVGLILGLVFLFVGFWKTLFFAFLTGLGFYIGKELDRKEDLKHVLESIQFDKWMRK